MMAEPASMGLQQAPQPTNIYDPEERKRANPINDVYANRDPSNVASTSVPKVTSPEELDGLPEGSQFIDPEGVKRVKPFTVKNPEDIQRVPEGGHFVDPEGTLRMKPTYQGVDFTAQTLYDMGVNDKERRRALERSYPGKVKEDVEGLYVDDDGVLRKPGHGVSKVTGFAAASAAPTILSVLGALGGGAVGSVEPGGGTIVGGAVGGAGGAMLGQSFNDLITGLAGTYDRTPVEEAANVGMAGASGMMGAGVGRGIATVVPSAKAGVSALTSALPGLARSVAGATGEDINQARTLMEKGVLVPPSSWAKELPHVINTVEVFDPAFHTQKPLTQSATAHYEKSAGAVLNELGIKDPGSLTKPLTDVPTKEAGETIRRRTLTEAAEADAKLQAALEQQKASVASGAPSVTAQRETLQRAAEESRAAAQKLIDAGFKDIDTDVKISMQVAKADFGSGDLWAAVGQKLVAMRRAIGDRASKMYDAADHAAGGHLPNTEGLSNHAQEFLDQLPPDFQAKYPDIVRKLRDLAGVRDPETGEFIKEPVNPTFGQLHNMRSQMRSNVNYSDLTPDIRDGTYKFFSNKVDAILHDKEAVPELRTAADLLDGADKFYADNIKIFNAQQVKAVMRGLEAGEPADPQNLYNVLVKTGQTELTNRLKEIVGPNIWSGVKAADTQAMLDASKTLVPGEVDGRTFAREVLARDRENMLEVVYGKEGAEKLREQARRIEMLNGRVPIPANAKDTVTQVLARARQAEELAKAEAKRDPLATLNKEMRKVDIDAKRQQAKLRAERRQDPLGFLYDPTTGASEAVDRILKNEDLILAAAAKFGEQSPEFEMLRQIWAQRLLTNTMEPSERLAKVAPEIQQLMFPGVSLNQMKVLAKEMNFLLDTVRTGDQGSSMSAFQKVEHPPNLTSVRGLVKSVPIIGPLTDVGTRITLGWYYGLVRNLANKPALLRWLERGLSGTKEQRDYVRQEIGKILQRGGAVGAGAAEATYQGAGD